MSKSENNIVQQRHDKIQQKLNNRVRALWDEYSDLYTIDELEVTAFVQLLHELREGR